MPTRKKVRPEVDSPICHHTKQAYMLYYWVGMEAFRYRLRNKRIVPLFLPVYKKGEIDRYQKIFVNAWDVLYRLGMHGQIDIDKVLEYNPSVGRFRKSKKEPMLLKKVKDKLMKRLSKQQQRSWK